MTPVRPEMLRTFWEPQWAQAWKFYLEEEMDLPTLCGVLQALPSERGSVSGDSRPTDPFVVLFTHDLDNEGARANETWILAILAERRLVTFFGAEGASGPFAIDPYRAYPDRAINRGISEHFLKSFLLSPLEAVAITCKDPVFLWGVEDQQLYEQAIQEHNSGNPNYWKTIDKRAPLLFENLLAKMKEMNVSIGGICVSDYNFGMGKNWLSAQGIGHLGIRAAWGGTTHWGRTDKILKGEPYDESEARLLELFGGSQRPKKGVGSFFKALFRRKK